MTKRLYYQDSYQVSIKSNILSSGEDGLHIVLDETIFYPTSGGQPHDTGTINGVAVIDVWEENDEIIHRVKSPLKAGEANCEINWSRRFDHMQQHSGQHLLSAAFEEIYQAPTLSFHLGSEMSTIDIQIPKLSIEECDRVEEVANEFIFKNVAIKSYQIPQSQREQLAFRKPPQVEGPIRVVEIDSLDYSACGGTHVKSTGELGCLKITDFESYKGLYRVSFTCGKRTLLNHQNLQKTIHTLKRLFAAPASELVAKAESLIEMQTFQAKQLKQYADELLEYQMQALYDKAPLVHGIKFCHKEFDDQTINIRNAAQKIIHSQPNAICIFLQPKASNTSILLAASNEVQIQLDVILKRILEKYGGKGGGSPHLAQGGIPGQINSELLLNFASSIIFEKLKKSK